MSLFATHLVPSLQCADVVILFHFSKGHFVHKTIDVNPTLNSVSNTESSAIVPKSFLKKFELTRMVRLRGRAPRQSDLVCIIGPDSASIFSRHPCLCRKASFRWHFVKGKNRVSDFVCEKKEHQQRSTSLLDAGVFRFPSSTIKVVISSLFSFFLPSLSSYYAANHV